MSLQLVGESDDRRVDPIDFGTTASRLIADDQDVVTVPAGTTAKDALALMKDRDFSQLPVSISGEVIGVFSHQSFAEHLLGLPSRADALEAVVEDMAETSPTYLRAKAPLEKVFQALGEFGYALIGNPEKLLAVVTDDDARRFLWAAAQPMLLLKGIELAVRELMRSACASEDVLNGCIATARLDKTDAAGGELLRLETLDFGKTIRVLTNGDNYRDYFQETFGPNRQVVRASLEEAAEIRNQTVHFKGEISAKQLETLVARYKWLLMRLELDKARLNS